MMSNSAKMAEMMKMGRKLGMANRGRKVKEKKAKESKSGQARAEAASSDAGILG